MSRAGPGDSLHADTSLAPCRVGRMFVLFSVIVSCQFLSSGELCCDGVSFGNLGFRLVSLRDIDWIGFDVI